MFGAWLGLLPGLLVAIVAVAWWLLWQPSVRERHGPSLRPPGSVPAAARPPLTVDGALRSAGATRDMLETRGMHEATRSARQALASRYGVVPSSQAAIDGCRRELARWRQQLAARASQAQLQILYRADKTLQVLGSRSLYEAKRMSFVSWLAGGFGAGELMPIEDPADAWQPVLQVVQAIKAQGDGWPEASNVRWSLFARLSASYEPGSGLECPNGIWAQLLTAVRGYLPETPPLPPAVDALELFTAYGEEYARCRFAGQANDVRRQELLLCRRMLASADQAFADRPTMRAQFTRLVTELLLGAESATEAAAMGEAMQREGLAAWLQRELNGL